MKRPAQLQKEILQLHDAYWNGYMNGDIKGMSQLLDEGYTQVGSAETEVFSNKKDAVKFLRDTIDQVAGKLEMRKRHTRVEALGDLFLVHEQCDVYVLDGKKWIFYSKFRASTWFKETKRGWKIIHQHSSFPDTRAGEGENIATEKISRENQQLREAVKRRTKELEDKNRELEIEAALERVRSRALSMHHSEELSQLVSILFDELVKLDLVLARCIIWILNTDDRSARIWIANIEDRKTPESFRVPPLKHPYYESIIKAWKKKNPKWIYKLGGAEKRSIDRLLLTQTELSRLPKIVKKGIEEKKHVFISGSFQKFGFIEASGPQRHKEEQVEILSRFTRVFDQAYTRFLDLQKAEEQAREAEIQLAMERVRARTMAMQNSGAFPEVAALLFDQVKALGIDTYACGFNIWDAEHKNLVSWMSNPRGTLNPAFEMPIHTYDQHERVYQSWKKGDTFFEDDLRGRAVARHYKFLRSFPLLDEAFSKSEKAGIKTPDRQVHNNAHFSNGYLLFITTVPCPQYHEIFRRFAKVFNQTYTRFLDLQKAELLAREAQIETALERVRARALAMRQSEELLDVAKVLREQMGLLGQPELETSAVHLYEEDPDNILSWRAFRLGSDLRSKVSHGSMAIPKDSCEIVREFTRKFYSDETAYTIEISGTRQRAWYKVLFKIAPDVAHAMKKSKSTREKRFYHFSKFSGGALLMVSSRHPSRETIELQKRSADVFDLAYRRFKDLKNAEAQTREAQIEAALERVRARTMAMHKSTELPETAAILFNEFEKLGAGILLQATIGLYHPDKRLIEFHATNPEGGGIRVEKAVSMSMDEPTLLRPITKAWEEHKKSVVVELTGKKLETWLRYRNARMGGNVKSIDTGGRRVITAAFFSKGHLTLSSAERRPAEIVRLLERFAAVFDGTYTRFLDLQKAEAQAREAQIEAALEKIRSRSLAMHRSDELKDVIAVLFEKLSELKVLKGTIAIQLFDRQTKDSFLWVGNSIQEPQMVSLPFNEKMLKEETYLRDGWEAMNKGLEIINKEYTIKQKDRFFDYIFANNDFTIIPETPRQVLKQIQHYVVCLITEKHSALFADSFDAGLFDYDSLNVLRRASRVFEQAYIRFLDLQKAEVQAREAQIEAALERVRARTMAMHKSDELREAGELLWNELTKLGIQSISSGYVLIDEEKKIGWTYAPNPATGNKIGEPLGILHSETKEMREVLAAWKKQQPFSVVEMDEQEMITHQTFIAERSLSPDGKITKWITASQLIALSPIRLFLHNFNFKQGYLLIVGGERLNEAQIELMLRFTGVFQQTYTRFLDLQKAESQAREAQIEASLERVRSKTMAMHNSQDVGETVVSMFNEFVNLGIHTNRCGILIFNDEHVVEVWTARSMQGRPAKLIIGQLELSTHRMLRQVYDAWKEKETFYQYDLLGDDLVAYYTAINNSRFYPTQFNLSALPPEEFHSDFFFTDGAVFSFSGKPLIEEHARIMNRFAGVFGQTYRRYLDLKRAEAQAREAQIEAALERVRAKAMAMKQSTDLLDIVVEMRKEFTRLGHEAHYFWYMNWLPDKYEKAMTSGDGSRIGMVLDLPRGFHGNAAMTAWEANQEPLGIFTFDADSAIDYLNQMASFGQFRQVDPHAPGPDAVKAIGGLTFVMARTKHGEIGYSLPGVVPDPPAEDMKTLTRFAGVFDLAYQRYVDIEKAEASAKAALQQASVDRVRAEIASMRTVQDLDRITPLIWSELTALSIPFVRCGVFIMDDHDKQIHTFLSTPDGKAIAAFHLPFDTAGNLAGAINGWRIHQRYVTHWVDKDFELQADVLVKQGSIANREQYLHAIPKEGIYLHFLPFLQGMLYVGHTEALGDEDLNLVQSVADAFSTAYARYEDFNKLEAAKKEVEKTLSDLKQAQQQLVQSEKMASLGELTAGIAHEIQNPLNFVNNFSEVSNELVREIQEIRRKTQDGKVESEESQLLNDIARNLEKINFHGKRADAIVKSMLQHSRAGSDKKESTDINALCDEYLRLAFHGLRAKDKSFNAKFESSLDPTLRKIDVMPQEIGRVILNLINNAFYAVNERAKSESPASGFQPQVNVSTKALGNKIQIMIRDNGTGIPEKVRDKIFQPFFTTKPTGQGTGLGLSLAYDIVTKAHGGELKVETKEGEGTEFKILLPIQF